MAEIANIGDGPGEQRRAMKQALATLRLYEFGQSRPLLSIDEPSHIFGAIHGLAAVMSTAVGDGDGVNDAITQQALAGIQMLATLGAFAAEARS